MQDNKYLHFSEKLGYWFDSFKYFTDKNRFNFLFFDSPQMEVAYCENYDSIQERMDFIKDFMAFDEISHYIKITFNSEKSRCEGFLKELMQDVERLEHAKTECWLKSMIENFENENTQFAGDLMPPALYHMMHELYYLCNDAVSDCNKIFALYSDLPSVLPSLQVSNEKISGRPMKNIHTATSTQLKDIADFKEWKRQKPNDIQALKSMVKAEEKKSTLPTFVVMLEVAETINRVDKFLPQDWINRTDKLSKYKKAIFDRFGFDYAESTIKNNIDKIPTHTHRLKVVKMLNEYGFMNLAKQYQLQYKCTA